MKPIKLPIGTFSLLGLTALALLACGNLEAQTAAVIEKDDIVESLAAKPALVRSWNGASRSVVAREEATVSTRAILFKFGTAEIEGDSSFAQLRELGQALSDSRLRDAVIEVQGHTDNVGDEKANQALSEKRALQIVDTLVKMYGVPAQNLQATGKGETAPVAGSKDLQSDEQRTLNRRVVLIRIK
jgi:outer membrane protein OmpA-like peptidoglycan-associated protein